MTDKDKSNLRQLSKMITDLDQSDEPQRDINVSENISSRLKSKKTRKHQHRNKNLKKLSANFPSVDSIEPNMRNLSSEKNQEENRYLKLLVQSKDNQIGKLIQKVTDLQNYNEEFAQENHLLQNELQLLNRKLESLSKSLDDIQHQKCEECIKWQLQKDNLLKTNKFLADDVTMMKTLVHRLNVQIERYQNKMRKIQLGTEDMQSTEHPLSETSQQQENFEWGLVNTHTLGPLLSAYEEMIKEKLDLVHQYESEINRFTGNLKEIVEENEKLHKDLDAIRKGKESWREERTRLQAQIEICRSKAEIQTRRGDIAKEKLIDVLRCYEQKVQSQSLDLERLQEAYTRAKSELVSYKMLNNKPEAIIDSLKECQQLFEELRSQHSNDKARIHLEMEEIRKQKCNLEEKNEKLKEEMDILKANNHKQSISVDEILEKNVLLKNVAVKLKESRDRLKSRLRIALQWAHKLESTRSKMKNTWNELKELEAIVRNKEAQIRGLHARHLEEMDKMEKKLGQRDETIRSILKDRAKIN